MSGLFDFMKKPKKPEQKSLYPAPIPASNLPAPVEKKLNPLSIFKPQSTLPVKKKETPGFFSALIPSAPEKQEVIPAPPPASRAPAVAFPMAEEEKGEVRDIFAPMRPPQAPQPTPATRYVFIKPSAPPATLPRVYGLPAPAPQPVREWGLPNPYQLAEHFKKLLDLPQIWDRIRDIRAMPAFKYEQIENYRIGIPMVIPITPVVYREFYIDFAEFYGVPWSVVSAYMNVPAEQVKMADEALWNNVFSPLNSMVPEAFEILKPLDIPGFFNVSFTNPKTPKDQGMWMALATEEARRLNSEFIGTEHILLGIIREGGVAAKVLKNLNVDLSRVRQETEKLITPPTTLTATQGEIPFSPRARHVMDLAGQVARDLGRDVIGTEHLLLGLMWENEGVAAQALVNLGLRMDKVRDMVLEVLRKGEEEKGHIAREYWLFYIEPLIEPPALPGGSSGA